MTVSSIKVRIQRKAIVKLKVLPRFPANVAVGNFLTVTKANGTYTFGVDYTLLGPGPITDPTTAMVAILDTTSGTYKEVSLSSLLTSGLDADLQAIAALTGTGILARTAANTWVLRSITGTANEITVTNGDGVAGAPTLSLPTALTFTGKTVTGGTFNSPALVTPALGVPASGTLTNATGLPISTGVSGLATGVATFLGTPSSANLRAALTDEVGAGAAYFVGGALGTPASGTATNLTGLPLSGLTTQGAYTIVANNTSGAAVPTAVDITALTSKASPVSGDIVLIQDSAASNAFKKTTVGALASAGSVGSFNGRTGAVVSAANDYTIGLLAAIANNTIVGNNSGGSGVPLALGADAIATLLRTGTGTTGVLQSKIISSTRSLSTGSQSISYTGVGFKPTSIISLSVVNATTAAGVGFADSGLSANSISFYGSNLVTFNSFLVQSFLPNGTAGDHQTAAVTSYDADGFTLSWTKTGVPTGTVNLYFLCLR